MEEEQDRAVVTLQTKKCLNLTTKFRQSYQQVAAVAQEEAGEGEPSFQPWYDFAEQRQLD